MNNQLSAMSEDQLLLLSGFVALGVICDMVPLSGMNHCLARLGLRLLNSQQAPDYYASLRALWLKLGWHGQIDEYGIGFGIGPRLNAGSRMGKSRYAFDVLMGAVEPIEALERMNNDRRRLQDDWFTRLRSQNAMVVWHKHCAVAFLACSLLRVCDYLLYRPSFSVSAPMASG